MVTKKADRKAKCRSREKTNEETRCRQKDVGKRGCGGNGWQKKESVDKEKKYKKIKRQSQQKTTPTKHEEHCPQKNPRIH